MKKHLRILVGCAAVLMLVGCDRNRNRSSSDELIPLPPLNQNNPQEPGSTDPSNPLPTQDPQGQNNGGTGQSSEPGLGTNTECSEPRTSAVLPPLVENENTVQASLSFEDLRLEIDAACANCHLAPASKTGGFWYSSSFEKSELRVNGQKVLVNGIADVAETMKRVLGDNRMPPETFRKAAPQKYTQLQSRLEDWIAAGKPAGQFPLRSTTTKGNTAQKNQQSDLGSCIPRADQIGIDTEKDELFRSATQLPEKLSQTDLFSLDSLALARKGTVSYNVEYPLWADNAEKGRYVHFPAVWDEANKKWKTGGAAYDTTSQQLTLPPNTRFYKTFYKAVKNKTGVTVFRKVETRILVVRKAPQEPLLGTYKWNENESEAQLVTLPYRDGTPFKDDIFKIVIDENTGQTRKYAIPGKQRCVECHKGTQDYVLGFTPLQLNRRTVGSAGRERDVGADELSQIQRFLDAGILQNVSSPEELPKLESSGPRQSRNVHETRLQGYMVGNCSHCHNPNGFAMKDNKVTLDLREGQLFDFDVRRITRDSNRSSPKYFAKPGDLQQSQIYLRVSASKIGDGGRYLPMPMHTPGDANCKLLNLTAKWIYSLSTDPQIAAKSETEPITCEKNDDFPWIDLDMTWPKSTVFVPRRADWKDPANGMPKKFLDLKEDENLMRLLRKPVAVDFWERVLNADGKPQPKCDFPPKKEPTQREKAAWMLDAQGKLKQPAGELYTLTPGAHFYNTTCAKCHGTTADGRSGLATNLLTLSGGSIRVANLKDGLFGPGNQTQFDVPARNRFGKKQNLAGNYLIWMAMEGTRVTFPPEMEPYVGRHKAQMLNQLRERCKNFIASSPQKASDKMKDYLAFRDVCFYKNGKPDDKDIQFDPSTDQPLNPEALEAWADRAAINVGWAIFEYLNTEGSAGKWQPLKNECDKIYPARQGP